MNQPLIIASELQYLIWLQRYLACRPDGSLVTITARASDEPPLMFAELQYLAGHQVVLACTERLHTHHCPDSGLEVELPFTLLSDWAPLTDI